MARLTEGRGLRVASCRMDIGNRLGTDESPIHCYLFVLIYRPDHGPVLLPRWFDATRSWASLFSYFDPTWQRISFVRSVFVRGNSGRNGTRETGPFTTRPRFRTVFKLSVNLQYRSLVRLVSRSAVGFVFSGATRFRAISPAVVTVWHCCYYCCSWINVTLNDCYLILVRETVVRYCAVCYGDTRR